MNITVELPPQIERAYIEHAQARGLKLADLIREILVASQPQDDFAALTPLEWVREFKAWTHSHAADNLPVLSDKSISRETIYKDRGL